MNKIEIMENMISRFKENIEELKPSLESRNADKRERARDAIDYAKKQIIEAEEVIQKERCDFNCEECKHLPNLLKEQA